MLEGFNKLKKEIKNIELLIIGPVDKKDKDKFYSIVNKSTDVIHYEWKDMSEFPSFVSYSDICVSPLEKNPHHESGVANKVYQYMLFGKPVLVSNCKPQSELIESTESGLVFEHDSVTDFVDKSKTLLSNPEMCVKMGENGKKAIISNYNMENYSQKLLEIYISI